MTQLDPDFSPETLRIYVVHYTPFTERRVHMEQVLREHGLDQFPVRWVTEHDREEILGGHARGEWGPPGKIAAGSVSLILKHMLIYRLSAEAPGCWHLILEDDILIRPDFISRLKETLQQLPEDWELFFVGEGCNLHVPWWRRRADKTVYFRGWKPWWRAGAGASRCTEGYLIHPEFASRFLQTRFARPPFDCPIDWQINKAGYEMHIRSYWAEPPLLRQGAFESWTKNPVLNPVRTLR